MYKLVRAASRVRITNRKYCEWNKLEDPNTQITVLANGMRVATEETCSPLACVSLFIEAGPRFETPSNNGISHFIEHMAFKGFNSMNTTKLAELILHMGAKITVKTSRELQILTAVCPAEHAHHIIDIYSKFICDQELNSTLIENEKYVVCDEMEDAENNPKLVTFNYLHQTAFQGTSLAQSVLGPSWNLQLFDKEFVHSYMSQQYQPDRFCLATCGGVSHDKIVDDAKQSFGHVVPDPEVISSVWPCRFSASQVIYRNDDLPFTHVAIAFETPGYSHRDYLPLLVMSCMTGTWCKSQLGNQGPPLAIAAAHDLCHYYDSFFIPYHDVGLWGIYYVAEKLQVDDMLNNIQKQWMYMCLLATSADVERAINAAKMKLARRVCGVVKCSHDIGYQMMYAGGRRAAADFQRLVATNVTVHSVRDTAYKYLYNQCPAVAAVGPTEALPDYVRIAAGQYSLLS